MFEKHRNNKPEPAVFQPQQDSFTANPGAPANSGRAAVIGPGICITGDISGDENLIIEGKVDGKIRLEAHQVDIGQSGRVNADITAKVIKIAGEVRGDLNGTEKVVILRSGNVHGNIIAPRMTLEDGAIFKGSIDMDPGEPVKPKIATPVKKAIEKPLGKTAEKSKVISTDKLKEKNSYSLSGG
jgi:cytoskeletal protein CcmA (bactofilin family)